MITYVDTSSLLKLVVDEVGSERAALIWDRSDALASASLVLVESRAALAAATRAGRLDARDHGRAKAELADLVTDLHLVAVTDELIEDAATLAEDEGLRGYDAVHLAAALNVGASLLTSADGSLCEAASRNGLHVANPLDEPSAPGVSP